MRKANARTGTQVFRVIWGQCPLSRQPCTRSRGTFGPRWYGAVRGGAEGLSLWLVAAQRRWQCLWGSATSRPDAGCAGLRLRDFTEQDAENPAVLTALKTEEGHPENTCSRLNVNNEPTHLVEKMIVMFKTNFSSQ